MSPTYSHTPAFPRDWDSLSAQDKQRFLTAAMSLVEDLIRIEVDPSANVRNGLRVKRVQGHPDVWEMTWAPDGRATFSYGPSIIEGKPHIVWRRCGTHDIFRNP